MSTLGRVEASGGTERWRTEIRTGRHALVADEHQPDGADAGPNPFAYLLTALAACTDITLRMYAERKGWALQAADVACTFHRDGSGSDAVDHIERVLHFDGDLEPDQVERLADIAERTPVTLVVKRGTEVRTTVT